MKCEYTAFESCVHSTKARQLMNVRSNVEGSRTDERSPIIRVFMQRDYPSFERDINTAGSPTATARLCLSVHALTFMHSGTYSAEVGNGPGSTSTLILGRGIKIPRFSAHAELHR